MSETPETTAEETSDSVAGPELQRFVDRYENLEEEKKNSTEDQKAVIEELAARGYDKKVFKKIIALRKRDPDDVAEEEAVLDLYKAALKMA